MSIPRPLSERVIRGSTAFAALAKGEDDPPVGDLYERLSRLETAVLEIRDRLGIEEEEEEIEPPTVWDQLAQAVAERTTQFLLQEGKSDGLQDNQFLKWVGSHAGRAATVSVAEWIRNPRVQATLEAVWEELGL